MGSVVVYNDNAAVQIKYKGALWQGFYKACQFLKIWFACFNGFISQFDITNGLGKKKSTFISIMMCIWVSTYIGSHQGTVYESKHLILTHSIYLGSGN